MTGWALAAAGVCAVSTGVLLAFALSVLPALSARPAAEAVAAMQAMNRVIVNPLFLALLFGGGVLACVAGVTAVVEPSDGGFAVLAAAVAYVVGVLGVTIAVNVPLNDRLADARPDDPEAWPAFTGRWAPANVVRVCAGAASVVGMLVGAALG